MKAQTSAALANWLANPALVNYERADLFRILLLNGSYITTTTAQGQDINFTAPSDSQRTYNCSRSGRWQRGVIRSKVSFNMEADDLTLTLIAEDTVLYPGSTASMMSVIQAGLFDKAVVDIFTIYWGQGETPYAGIARGFEHKYSGEILQVSELTRTLASFKVADPTYRLNLMWPRNLIQSGCRHVLFDPVCTLNQNSFALNNTVAANSTQLLINLVTALSTASWWNSFMTVSQGKLQFTSGQNAGLWYPVKIQNSTTQITLAVPTAFPVATGDTFTIYPGCAKTQNACLNQFNNLINNGGFPYVPNPEIGL